MRELFTETKLKGITFKNKFVRSATHEYLGNGDGTISEKQMEIYKELAKNEVGLIITAHSYVCSKGCAGPGQNGISEDRFIEGYTKLTEVVHTYGGKIILQLAHAGGRAKPLDGSLPLAPSPIVFENNTQEISVEDIIEIRASFKAAAKRAKAAGFDGVQIHAAHGYLLSQFIDPVFNKRQDIYGGSAVNRFRLAQEIITDIKQELKDFPVFIKINSDSQGDDEAYGQDMLHILSSCKNLGVAAAELSGNFLTMPRDKGPYFLNRALNLRKAVALPIILVGGIRTPVEAEDVLISGIDMVSLARPFICEPDLIEKFKLGQAKAKCISCNQCFSLMAKEGRRCIFH